MNRSARTKIIRIGNSRGIRIPKAILDRLNLTEDVEIAVKGDHLEVRAGRKPRDGWNDAFSEMAATGDDQLMDQLTTTKWDDEEWTW